MSCDLSKHIESFEGKHVRSKGTRTSTLHLVVKHEKIVIKGQNSPTGKQVLMEDLDSSAVYKITAERTPPAVLKTKGAARVLSTSKKQEETDNTYSPWAPCINCPIELILARYARLGWDPRDGVRACETSGEKGKVLEGAELDGGTGMAISTQGVVMWDV